MELIQRCWSRLKFTSEIAREPFEKFAVAAKDAGFLEELPDLSRLVESLR